MIYAREVRPIQSPEIFANPDLIAEYAQESSIPEIGEIDPQPLMYAAMEQTGILQCIGAFEWNRLVGFANVLCSVLPHYGKKVATIESIFVARASRPGGIGLKLMEAAESHAKASGCTAILYSAPTAGSLERLLSAKRKHYKRTNAIFCRSL